MKLLPRYTDSWLAEIVEALQPKPPPLKPGETRVVPVDPTPEDIKLGIVRFNVQHMSAVPINYISIDPAFFKEQLGTPYGPDGPIAVHTNEDGVHRLGLLELCDG